MKLRGYVVDATGRNRLDMDCDYIDFTIADCPILVQSAVVALSAIDNSRLLRYQTIVRGDESSNIFEGDIILNNETNEKLGIVTYKKGFKMQNTEGALKNIPGRDHIKIEEGNKETINLLRNKNRSPLRFCALGKVFSIPAISYSLAGQIYFKYNKGFIAIKPDQVRHSTGFNFNGVELAFGDEYNGGVIVLHNLQPAVKCRENIFYLEEEVRNGFNKSTCIKRSDH